MSVKHITFYLFVMLLGACAHVSVPESRRTTNPAYDGYWEGDISGTTYRQYLSGWDLTCGEVVQTLIARIEDGRISGYLKRNENLSFETNLNDRGSFYVAIPKEEKGYVDSPGSDATLPSDEFHVFRGRLDPETQSGSGRYVSARNDMGMEGCSTPIIFKRRS